MEVQVLSPAKIFLHMKNLLIYFLVPLLFFGALLSSCIRNPATRKVQARLLSPEAERKIGEATKEKIFEQYHVFPSTTVGAYVNRVGQKLASVSDRPTVDYEFNVLDNDLINAFAAPGGFIFVTRGLLENMNDEAELAMVLGHEIAHVAALHGVQMIQKEMGQNALTILGTIGAALTLGPEAMIMVANTADLFSSLYLLGYSREKELEADNLGLQYLLRAGYDPQASVTFLKQLQKQDDDKAKGWDLYFRTHPNTSERIEIIESMIGRSKRDETVSYEEFKKIKALLPKIEASERGAISGQSYANAVHDVILTVPKNWTLGYTHPQSLVSFQTADRHGEGRLQVVALSSTTRTGNDLAHQFAKEVGYKFVSGRDVLYAAGYGYLGRFQGVSPGGKLMDIRLFAVLRRGRGYVLLCGAEPEKADSYLLDIESIMRGLKFT